MLFSSCGLETVGASTNEPLPAKFDTRTASPDRREGQVNMYRMILRPMLVLTGLVAALIAGLGATPTGQTPADGAQAAGGRGQPPPPIAIPAPALGDGPFSFATAEQSKIRVVV